MGSRANGVIVSGGAPTVYYSHYAAEYLASTILRGPDYVLRHVESWEAKSPESLMDDIWADAAVVLNLDHDSVGFFQGGVMGRSVPLLRRYLQQAKRNFGAFDIRWLYCGMRDIAIHAGLPQGFMGEIRGPEFEQGNGQELLAKHFSSAKKARLLCSVKTHGGDIRLHGLKGFRLADSLRHGPALFELCGQLPGTSSVRVSNDPCEFPEAGVHIDFVAGALDYWSAEMTGPEVDAIGSAWEGWKVQWHQDRYEMQIQETGGMIRVPEFSEDILQSRLKEVLFSASDPMRDAIIWEG